MFAIFAGKRWATVLIFAVVFAAGLGIGLVWDSKPWKSHTNQTLALMVAVADYRAIVATRIKSPEDLYRSREAAAIKERKDLEARGVSYLATALLEIHRALYRYEPWHNDDVARVQSLKMMFDIWAKMPAPKDECPGRTLDGHQDCSALQRQSIQ